MNDDDLTAFVDALLEARASGLPFTPGAIRPRDRRGAYEVQSRVVAALGPVAGFKTARRPGEDPIMAPILERDVYRNGVSIPVAGTMGVELEVGLRIRRPIPEAPSDEDLARCVEPVAVVELVATRIAGDVADDPIVKLADNQINHGLVIGETASDWDGSDLRGVTASMHAGKDVLVDGIATVPGGSAFGALRGLLGILGRHCGGLSPGQIVITGSLHPLAYVPGGVRIDGRIDGIGRVEVDMPNGSPLPRFP